MLCADFGENISHAAALRFQENEKIQTPKLKNKAHKPHYSMLVHEVVRAWKD